MPLPPPTRSPLMKTVIGLCASWLLGCSFVCLLDILHSKCSIFVGNLTNFVSRELLVEAFSEFGNKTVGCGHATD